jgi:crotonobetainyl-CoA:carnitine CoA-transferase CaiB-like acyl-CoA transferase
MSVPGVEGTVVIEMAEGIAGPFCGTILAGLGARVIKVEPPEGDWARTTGPPFLSGWSAIYLSVNRGKESLSLNLRDPRGAEVVRRLAGQSDVIVVGYRPGVAERLGLGAEELVAANPRLVHCSISGYGNRGPKRERPGSDTILQGYAGLMSVTGEPDRGPSRVGTPLADTASGVYAALGVMTMLLRRTVTGKGGICDTSLLEALIHLQAVSLGMFAGGASVPRLGSRSSLSAVPAQAFATADGYVNLSCHGTRQWRRLCQALGHPEWETRTGISTNEERVQNHAEVVRLIEGALAQATTAEWMETFEREGVNAGVINTYADVVADEQVRALGILESHVTEAYGAFDYVGVPLTFDLGRDAERLCDPPALGQHTRALLAEAGYADVDVDALIDSEVAVATA